MKNQQYNFASESRWICSVPVSTLFNDLDNDFSLNLTKFSIPEFEIGTVRSTYAGYSVEMPNGLMNAEEKRIELTYLLSNDFSQYITLYRWLEALSIQELYTDKNPTANPNVFLPPAQDLRLPVSITLLSEFDKPIIRVKYHDCFIVMFSRFDLDYTTEQDAPISHSFTLAYSRFEFEKL